MPVILCVVAVFHFISTGLKCPALSTPLNGALACVTGLSTGRLCQLQCNSHYDIPERNGLESSGFGDGIYLCSAAVWLPNSLVPNCSGKK